MSSWFPFSSIWPSRGPTKEAFYSISSFTKGASWVSSGSSLCVCSKRLTTKAAAARFIASLGIAFLLQHKHAAAIEAFSSLGEWSTQTLKQIQEALSGQLIFLGSAPQEPPVPTTPGFGMPSGPLLPLGQQAGPFHDTAIPGLRQQLPPAPRESSSPEQIARDIVVGAERSLHKVMSLSSSVEDFVASHAQQLDSPSQVVQGADQQYHREPLEPHECLHSFAFAASVIRALQEEKLQETLKRAHGTVGQLFLRENEASRGPVKQHHAAPQQVHVPFNTDFLSAPLTWGFSNERVAESEGSTRQKQEQQTPHMQQLQRAELHKQLTARLDEIEKTVWRTMANMEEQLKRLFQWSDECSMEAIRNLKERVDRVTETVDSLLAADASFSASATSTLQRLLHMLGDRQTTDEILADTKIALKDVLQPALEELQHRQHQLQQQRLPVLAEVKKTREMLGLLLEAASGIARSGETDNVSYGAPFCENLLKQWKSLQPPTFEMQLLRAQQAHHEELIDGMKDLVQGLQAFVASGAGATEETKAIEAVGGQNQKTGAIMQQLCKQQQELERLVLVTASLRETALLLASTVQAIVKLLQQNKILVFPHESDTPPQHLLGLAPAELIDSMKEVQKEAAQVNKKLSATVECLKATASAHSATTEAVTTAAAAAKLLCPDAELDKEKPAAAPAAPAKLLSPGRKLDKEGPAATAGTTKGSEGDDQQVPLPHTQDKVGMGSADAETATDANTSGHLDTLPQIGEDRLAVKETGTAQDDGVALSAAPEPDFAESAATEKTFLVIAETANAAALGLKEGYGSLIRSLKDLLYVAALIYGQAQQHIRVAVDAYGSCENLRACEYYEREKKELRLVDEGTREQTRLQLRRRVAALARFAAAACVRNPRQR